MKIYRRDAEAAEVIYDFPECPPRLSGEIFEFWIELEAL
jgi:hypothetical protein